MSVSEQHAGEGKDRGLIRVWGQTLGGALDFGQRGVDLERLADRLAALDAELVLPARGST